MDLRQQDTHHRWQIISAFIAEMSCKSSAKKTPIFVVRSSRSVIFSFFRGAVMQSSVLPRKRYDLRSPIHSIRHLRVYLGTVCSVMQSSAKPKKKPTRLRSPLCHLRVYDGKYHAELCPTPTFRSLIHAVIIWRADRGHVVPSSAKRTPLFLNLWQSSPLRHSRVYCGNAVARVLPAKTTPSFVINNIINCNDLWNLDRPDMTFAVVWALKNN